MGQFCTRNALLTTQKHCGIDFRWLHIHAASIKPSYNFKKNWRKWTKKTLLKLSSTCANLSKTLFKVKQSFTERSA